jgi:5-formyltetrahydrofolate cyclo-ligase
MSFPAGNSYPPTAKAVLREQIRKQLARVPHPVRVKASHALSARLRRQPVWVSAKCVLGFAPLADEVDIWPLVEEILRAGKTLALPRFSEASQTYAIALVQDLSADLCDGRFGIREPRAGCVGFPLNRLDLALVPGMAFDLHGHRLGRGKGFYDRLLVDVRGVKCGLAFDEQLVPEVPTGPEDVRVDCIATPASWIECRHEVQGDFGQGWA